MSVIESLYFQLRGDSSDAENALTRVTGKAGKAEGALAGLISRATGMVGGYLAISTLNEKLFSTAEQMNRTREAADRMGVSIGDLDVVSRVMEDAGGSAEGFENTLQGLQMNMEMFKVKGTSRAHDFFKEMGINEGSYNNAMELINPLADALSKMTEGEAQGQGAKLGIDPATISVLRGGREELQKLIKEQEKFGKLTDEDAKLIAEYDDESDSLHRTFQGLWRQLALFLIPAFKKVGEFLKAAIPYIKDHRHLIMALGAAYTAFIAGKAVFAMATLVKEFGLLNAIAKAVGVTSWKALAPMLMMILVAVLIAAAFALIYEDIKNWQEGMPSLMGDIFGSWTTFEENLFDSIDRIKERLTELKTWFQEIIAKGRSVAEKIIGKKATDSIAERADNINMRNPLSVAKNLAGGWSDAFGGLNENLKDLARAQKVEQMAKAEKNRQPANISVGDVTVNTQASDTAGIGTAVQDAITKAINDANAQNDDGVHI